jgi:NAD(P)-dependent dehydrogenase (short-subunit alcohol dehydrogenase family)
MNKQPTKNVCLITGASSGIGFCTALALAAMDTSIIMVSRNQEKLQNAFHEITFKTKNKNVFALPCDLSSQKDIRKLSFEIHSRFDRLDVLINNAGIFRSSRKITEENYELTFAVNHLAPFLLTNLLLEIMYSSAPSRIINVVSSFHKMARIDTKDLHFTRKPYNGLAAYSNSKLANIMFTYELAHRLNGTGVTANASDPWGTRSEISRGQKGILKIIWQIFQPFLQPTKKGAETSVYLACSAESDRCNGKYFRHKKEYQTSKSSHDIDLSVNLWNECERLTGVSYNSVISSFGNSWK